MKAAVVDTNVLVVANRKSSHASPTCVLACTERLRAIMREGILVIDDGRHIFREYERRASSTGQPGVGDAFLRWALTNQAKRHRCERVPLTPRGGTDGDFEEFPVDPSLDKFHLDDRKFAAVARTSKHNPSVVNAVDTDWWMFREPLERHGIRVTFLCLDMMEAAARRGR